MSVNPSTPPKIQSITSMPEFEMMSPSQKIAVAMWQNKLESNRAERKEELDRNHEQREQEDQITGELSRSLINAALPDLIGDPESPALNKKQKAEGEVLEGNIRKKQRRVLKPVHPSVSMGDGSMRETAAAMVPPSPTSTPTPVPPDLGNGFQLGIGFGQKKTLAGRGIGKKKARSRSSPSRPLLRQNSENKPPLPAATPPPAAIAFDPNWRPTTVEGIETYKRLGEYEKEMKSLTESGASGENLSRMATQFICKLDAVPIKGTTEERSRMKAMKKQFIMGPLESVAPSEKKDPFEKF